MSAHVFPCDNKTFLIAVRTTCEVQTLHFKNLDGKRELPKSESRKSECRNKSLITSLSIIVHILPAEDVQAKETRGRKQVAAKKQ